MEFLNHYQDIVADAVVKYQFTEKPRELYEPMNYIISHGGKRLRPIMVLMACDLFGGNIDAAVKPALAIEFFHNFTLIHDDIMDQAPIRRNVPTIHTLHGIEVGILAGDGMLIKAYQFFEDLEPTLFKKCVQIFSHTGAGLNDAQKVMGIIGAAVIYYHVNMLQDPMYLNIPSAERFNFFAEHYLWVPLVSFIAIGLGTMSGGWKIVKTMGTRITKVTPLEGVSAETAGALTLFLTDHFGIPVSTTHTITGSIIGVGLTKRVSAVRWGITVSLLWAWILTIPISAAFAASIYLLVQSF